MALLSTFSTNSINILAGINGSEVSQALIIALSVIINDLLYLPWPIGFKIPLHLLGNNAELEFGGVWNAGMAHGSRELVERHLFSLYFMLPLVAVCTGFMYHNWWVMSLIPVMGPNWHLLNPEFQVSSKSVPRGHAVLCDGNGFRCSRNPSPLFKNPSVILLTTNIQFHSVVSTAFWTHSMPSAQGTKVSRNHLVFDLN
jgi:hypothetical protein